MRITDAGDVHSWKEVFEDEAAFLDARNPDAPERPYSTGIALSGGGIRSAAVCLGMLQVLAGKKLLKHFDYLSMVSGGGYIGSALALRLAQVADSEAEINSGHIFTPDDVFPFGKVTKEGSVDNSQVEHFRHNASYLAPRGFGSLATGFFIVARSLLLNLFIWITIGSALLAVAMRVATIRVGGECWAQLGHTLFGNVPDRYFFVFMLWLAAATLAILAMSVAGVSVSSWWVRSEKWERGSFGRARWAVPAIAVGLLAFALYDIPRNRIFDPWPTPPWPAPPSCDWPNWVSLSDVVQMALPVLALLAFIIPILSEWAMRQFYPEMATAGRSLSIRYARRRTQERLAGQLLTFGMLVAAIGAIPFVSDAMVELGKEWLGWRVPVGDQDGDSRIPFHIFLIYFGSGAAALIGYYNGHIRGKIGAPTQAVVIMGSILLVIGAAMIAHQVALLLFGVGNPFYWFIDQWSWHQMDDWPEAIAAGATLLAFALAIFVNINDMSLQRFYRDRLMEAFMPDLPGQREEADKITHEREAPKPKSLSKRENAAPDDGPMPGPASIADNTRLSVLAHLIPKSVAEMRAVSANASDPESAASNATPDNLKPRRPIGPYPIINSYLLARRYRRSKKCRDRTDDEIKDLGRLANRIGDRGGDSFILSPCFVGSTLTKWKRTNEVINDQLSLPTAMAISGAAINPGGGLAGRGVTTNYVTALAMSFLSLRLGYRMRWRQTCRFRQFFNPYGNHICPGASDLIAEIMGVRCGEDPAFIELSDGGHFDNLGLYELIRRRCRLILICDGGEDPTGSYAAFTSVLTMVREDFGVEVDFDRTLNGRRCDPAQLVARPRTDEYPKGAEFADRGFFLATIKYAKHEGTLDHHRQIGRVDEIGLVIYLKAAMLLELGLPSRGYKGAHPEFPYEPTSDQFFTPEQFAAYRDVGNKIALQMMEQTKLASFFEGDPTHRPDDFNWFLKAFPTVAEGGKTGHTASSGAGDRSSQ